MKSPRILSFLLSALLSSLTLALPLAGCADDDAEPDDPPAPQPQPQPVYTCTASIAPLSFQYRVGDGGRMLVIAPGTAQEDTFERVGVPAPTIQGTWLVDEKTLPAGKVRAELSFGGGDATVTSFCTSHTGKSGQAAVTVAASITSTMVSILASGTKTTELR